ncbi:hypothetical protein [Chromobacterium piscinae]|uniref:hypothetical protein n=1 Tax=Chromobacterium piscinae TaxID=686831 RepID=UPI003261389D
MKSDANRLQTREAVSLLIDAARPDRRHLWRGGFWLMIAALLEAGAPLLGSRLAMRPSFCAPACDTRIRLLRFWKS